MLLASFSEVLSIGAVLPFLGVLTAPEHIFEMPVAQPLISFFELTHSSQLILPVTIIFCIAALIAGVIRLILLWTSNHLSFAAGADLSLDIYRRTLYQPYAIHCARNSSEIISGISGKVNGVIFSIIMPMLTLVSSCVIVCTILIGLMIVDPWLTFLAFGGFGFIYRYTKNDKTFQYDWTAFKLLLDETEVTTYENIPIDSQNPSKILKRVITRSEPWAKFPDGLQYFGVSEWFAVNLLDTRRITERTTTTYEYIEITRNDIIVKTGQKLYEIKKIVELKESVYFKKNPPNTFPIYQLNPLMDCWSVLQKRKTQSQLLEASVRLPILNMNFRSR
jgi:ABC-type multidrug transport system fused ATPase/permease subunit